MLTVETIGRIRREHFIKGKTIREIARDLKVSRNTLRKVLRSGETSFEYERDVQPRPKLGRWTAEPDELLEGNATKPFREQLTLIRIFEELGADTTAATMLCGGTPDNGPRSAGNRRRRPTSR
jgi:predicted transcriptional regulator